MTNRQAPSIPKLNFELPELPETFDLPELPETFDLPDLLGSLDLPELDLGDCVPSRGAPNEGEAA